jgi:hypothetical protein
LPILRLARPATTSSAVERQTMLFAADVHLDSGKRAGNAPLAKGLAPAYLIRVLVLKSVQTKPKFERACVSSPSVLSIRTKIALQNAAQTVRESTSAFVGMRDPRRLA